MIAGASRRLKTRYICTAAIGRGRARRGCRRRRAASPRPSAAWSVRAADQDLRHEGCRCGGGGSRAPGAASATGTRSARGAGSIVRALAPGRQDVEAEEALEALRRPQAEQEADPAAPVVADQLHPLDAELRRARRARRRPCSPSRSRRAARRTSRSRAGRSPATRWPVGASAGIRCRHSYQCCGQPCRQRTTSSPSPASATWKSSPRASHRAVADAVDVRRLAHRRWALPARAESRRSALRAQAASPRRGGSR